MEAAKSVVNRIVGRGGQHDTHVEENVNPAVTQETVQPTRHEETTTALDKEVHQHHFHTTVQPLTDREVLQEQHRHQELPVQEKQFRHGDDSGVRRAVDTDAAQFRDVSQVANTTHTSAQAPSVAGERTYHHVHENVQPVIHKETIRPEVVHTTQPIHEKHQAPSEHHGMSVLPTKTLGEITSAGQNLTGTTHRTEHYEGDPRPYDASMQVNRHDVDKNFGRHDGLHGGADEHKTTEVRNTTTTGTTGMTGAVGAVGTATALSQHHSTSDSTSTDRQRATGPAETGNLGRDNARTHTTSQDPSSEGVKEHGLAHRIGHGITNQSHHGTERDNVDRNDMSNTQHGTQSRDPALVDSKTDKKLTGSGLDGSHSAVFGLTPDGHKHQETAHGSGHLEPAHGEGLDNTKHRGNQEKLAEQMNDPRVAEKSHGYNQSSTGSAKPGAGAPGGEQGFGQIRPEQHGTTDKIQNKIDPTTDADGDGKRGVMD